MEGSRRDAFPFEPAADLVGTMFGAREDQHAFHLFRLERMDEEVELPSLRGAVEMLDDRFDRIMASSGIDRVGVRKDIGSQLVDLGRDCGRKEHSLPFAGHFPNDLLDIVDKPHVQHPVGLIEHEDLDV